MNKTFQRKIYYLFISFFVLIGFFITPKDVGAAFTFVADRFDTVAYTNQNGSVNWSSNWTETNDNGVAGTGNVRIIGGELLVSSRTATNDGDFEAVQRFVDLSSLASNSQVLLSFSFRTTNLEANDNVAVEAYNGTAWTTLDTLSSSDTNGLRSYDISAYTNVNSAIRFRITANFDQTNEAIYFDDVKIGLYKDSSHTSNDVLQTVQTYYLPLPEDQVLYVLDLINAAANSPTYVYASITIVANNTVIYFDNWEDGYEATINDPVQSTTDVWGDGDLSNGAPPGYPNDLLNAGDIIVLTNPIDTSDLTKLDFDGGDKFASTDAIAVTRSSWASGSGTLHGGAEEVLDTSVWGTEYDVPVADSVSDAYGVQDFEYTALTIMASEDNTNIYINGAYLATIDEGESLLLENNNSNNPDFVVGDVVTSTAPVQVNLLGGNIGSNYQSDFFTLYPNDLLDNSYYALINSYYANQTSYGQAVNTNVLLYNPGPSSITVHWVTTAGAQSDITVPSKSTVSQLMPYTGTAVPHTNPATGAHFYTDNDSDVFVAISLNDWGNQAWDWGYTLVPENQLTQQAKVGWGPGQDPTLQITENGSPVWVMAVGPSSPIYICVDYDGDNQPGTADSNGYYYDTMLTLNTLQRSYIYDPDGDQTGMLLYLCNGSQNNLDNKIAALWGQDPYRASAGAPGLDVGTTVPPLPNFTAIKGAELIIDLNSNARFDVRDTFAYNIVIKNTGALPVQAGSIVVSDIVPQYTTYVTGSTTFFNGTTTTSIPDNVSPATIFPLDEGGYTIPQTLPIEGEFTVSFQVEIDPSLPGLTNIQNNAQVSGLDLLYDPTVEIVVQPPEVTNAIGNKVWIDENGDGVQDPGEPGLPNVTVELYDSTGTTLLASAVTDLNGDYLFPDLASDTYKVRVNTGSLPSGLSGTTLGTVGSDFNNQSQPYSVTVGGGENMTADFGYNWSPAANVNGNTGTGAIGDRLWVDADGDGLQDPGEPGLSGVTVRLLTDDNNDGVYGGTGDNPSTSTTTDSAGNYIFTGLAAGSYVVEVNNGSAPSGYSQTGDPDITADNRTTSPLVLAPGDVFLNADFGYQPSGASGTIGNTVWFNPDGDGILDVSEYGLAGVSVALVRDTNGNGIWDAGELIIATDITDVNGNYSFTGLPLDDGDGDADYLVWVNDTENILGELAPNYDSDGLSTPASGLKTTSVSAVAISTGSPTNNNQAFGYGPAEIVNGSEVGVIGDTLFLDRNGNGSFDPGEGLENVEIELRNSSGNGLIAYTRTDENGHYAFGGVPDGTYIIRVVQSTLPNGGSGLTNTVDPDTASPGDNQSSVTLSAGNRVNLDQDFGYVDSNPGVISGTLWTDTDANGTLDGGETGRFAGVSVVLLDGDGDLVASTVTDGSGNYSFIGLPAGIYYVHVTDIDNTLDGYWHSLGVSPGTDGHSQSDPYTVDLTAGGTNTTADFGYYRNPASIGDFVWNDINNNGIQDGGELGISSVAVTLTITWPGGAGTTVITTTTDSNGNYRFDNLLLDEDFDGASGSEPTYLVAFAAPSGYNPVTADVGGDDTIDSDGVTVSVTVMQGVYNNTIDSGFRQVVNIGDTLWYDWDGDGTQDADEPGISGVDVFVDLNNNGVYDAGDLLDTTDASGQYSFLGLAVGGSYRVIVDTADLPSGLIQTYDPDSVRNNEHTVNGAMAGDYYNVDFGYRGTGSISNFIWNDLNGDGVQDTGEGGISGVTVWVDLNNDNIQDATEPYDVSDANGQYYIDGLYAGTHAIRVDAGGGSPVNGAVSTYDLDGAGTPSVAIATLTPGQNRTDVDWGYQLPVLSVSKISNVSGTVNPGDTIQYTMTVKNNTPLLHTGIEITDPLPAGTIYDTQSTVANGFIVVSNYARDEFSSQSYARQDGDGVLNWAADWAENDPYGSSGPTGNYVGITGNRLFLHYAYVDDERIERSIDLSSYNSAELSFDWETVGIDVGECVAVRIYDGSSWTTLTTYTGTQSDNYSVDITSYISNDTRVRFANEDSCSNNWENGEYAYFDNVQITAFANPIAVTLDNIPMGTNPDLDDGTPSDLVTANDTFALNPGQEMTATFSVTVNTPIPAGLSSIANTACVTSTQQTTQQCGSVSDPLILSSIGDRVWLDEDSDGVQDAGEPGIPNTRVFLDTDNDGNYDVGEAYVYTDLEGNYIFKDVIPGPYNVAVDMNSLPTGLTNPTYDENNGTTNPDSRTPVTTFAGQEYATADFGYNWASATDVNNPASGAEGAIGDRIWIDADGDGVQDPGEAGLAGVTVTLVTPGVDGIFGTADDVTADTTTTDTAGNYIFDGLSTGAYKVTVTAPGGYARTGDPDESGTCSICDDETSDPIILAPGDVYVNADFGYQPTGGSNVIGNQIFVDANGDGNFDGGEPGIPGVSVVLQDGSGKVIATIITDENGQYSFPGLPNGTYTIWVNDTANVLGDLTQTSTPNNSADNGQACGFCNNTNTVTISGSSNSFQDFGYAPVNHDSGDGLIGDTIFLDRDGGNDYDPGEGLEGVNVQLYQDSNSDGNYDAGEPLLATTTTDENGNYYFGNLSTGDYVVKVDTTTLPLGVTNTVDVGDATLNEGGLTLAAGDVNLDQDFGYRDTSNPNSISGTIWKDTDADGTLEGGESGRFAGVTVALYNSSGDIVATTETNGSGSYSFVNLPDGTYTVDVTDRANILNGHWHSNGPNDGSDNNSQDDPYTVTVSGGQTNTTADFGYYIDPAAVSNYVWLDRNNDGIQDADEPAIPGVLVTLTAEYPNGDSASFSMLTNVDGLYSFENLLSDENFNLGDDTAGTPTYTITFTVPTGTVASPTGQGTASTDSNGTSTVVNPISQGDSDDTYDSGFYTNRLDLGDLPNAYSTLFSPGPAHVIFPDSNSDGQPETTSSIIAVWLGTVVDVEANGQPDVSAAGDDAATSDDEDGLALAATGWTAGSSSTATITVNSSAATTVYYGYWIDWNNDGDFADADDGFYSGSVATASPASVDVSVSVPASYVADSHVYMRLRADDVPFTSADFEGTRVNGEVEDYWYRFDAGGVTTPVTLSYFKTKRNGKSVNFEWSTSTETGNVGFNLYVDDESQLFRINDELILSQVVDSLERQDYTYDANVAGNRFYIEDVNIIGETELHGPFQLGQSYGDRVDGETIDWFSIQTEYETHQEALQDELRSDLHIPEELLQEEDVVSSIDDPRTGSPQKDDGDLAQGLKTTLNLKVRETGIYRVTYEQLKDAGLDLDSVPVSRISLYNHGVMVPIYIEGNGRFGPGDFVDFYGEALDTIYTDTNIYTLQVGRSSGRNVFEQHDIREVNAAPDKKQESARSYTETLSVNNQRTFASFAIGDDKWYDTMLLAYTTPKSRDFTFDVNGLENTVTSTTLELVAWGGNDFPESPDHHLLVSINGAQLANVHFDGLEEKAITLTLPAGLLREGINSLTLTLPGDTGVAWDMVALDKFSVSYPRIFQVKDDGRLSFTSDEENFTVTNLPSEDIVVYRINDSGVSRLKKVEVQAVGSTFSASFAGDSEISDYLVYPVSSLQTPEIEVTRVGMDLNQPAQFLIISHPDFIDGLQPLVQARQAQGLTVSVVDVNDLYAMYSFGIFEPQAIKDYIAFAAENLGTRYVLLVGGDTYDYRNYTGSGGVSFIPSVYAATGPLARSVPVDPLYTDLNGDNLPDLPIGRFPVRKVSDLNLVVQKTLDYQAKNYDRTAFFAADVLDQAVSFKEISSTMEMLMPADWTVESVHLDDLAVGTARQQLLEAMNSGTALVTYTGHSGPVTWTKSGLFTTADAASLTNSGRPFVVIQWGCWNTYYVHPTVNFMVQSLLFSGDNGAAAVLGAVTLTESDSERLLGELLTPRIVQPGVTIGDALQVSKNELSQTNPELLDVLLGWTLMGDPTLIIEP